MPRSPVITGSERDRLLQRVVGMREEMLDFAVDLVRIPTVNPPGQAYRPCAERIGRQLAHWGHEVRFLEAEGRPEHTEIHPRVNVVGRLAGPRPRPCLHFNGHFDVVPPGAGWTVDPFGGVVDLGRLYGRGSADMKAGLAAAATAVEAIRRSGLSLNGSVEVSATVDEETGGFAGVAHLADQGVLHSDRTDWVIIPEPFGPDRICLGHRGVYWFSVTAQGHAAHGSMPHQGRNAIADMAVLLERVRITLDPALEARVTSMPVVPTESRRGTINVNSIVGGQANQDLQSPCVADRCEAVFDRRFLAEEDFREVRAEMAELIRAVEQEGHGPYELRDTLVVEPVWTPTPSPLVDALSGAVAEVSGTPAALVASPGTYDQKHVVRRAGIEQCVAYGPGRLEQAHQPDEWCSVEDMVVSAQVMALAVVTLLGGT